MGGASHRHLELLAPARPERRGRAVVVELPRLASSPQAAKRAAAAIVRVREAARSAAAGPAELVIAILDRQIDWYLGDLVALARRLRFERVTLEVAHREALRGDADSKLGVDEVRLLGGGQEMRARTRERVLRDFVNVIHPRGDREHRIVRVNFHCNQACDFCFVARELPAPEPELIEAAIRDAAAAGASVALSGGEPTLNSRLGSYLALARDLGLSDVQLQTNAVRMSDPAFTASLVASGLRFAFVSLHGATATTSDRVTAAPGTFTKTIAGVRELLRAGVRVCLNFVLCAENAHELGAWPDFVARELRVFAAGGAILELNFSFVAPGSDEVPRDTAIIPRLSDVAPAIAAAVACARSLDLVLRGFDSQCGVPACFLPPEVREAWLHEPIAEQERAAFAASFRKGEACASCAWTSRCYGVREGYADMYGTSELMAPA